MSSRWNRQLQQTTQFFTSNNHTNLAPDDQKNQTLKHPNCLRTSFKINRNFSSATKNLFKITGTSFKRLAIHFKSRKKADNSREFLPTSDSSFTCSHNLPPKSWAVALRRPAGSFNHYFYSVGNVFMFSRKSWRGTDDAQRSSETSPWIMKTNVFPVSCSGGLSNVSSSHHVPPPALKSTCFISLNMF